MSIEYFTPLTGTLGGFLIGGSAAILLLFNGDILGASGIVSTTVLDPVKAFTDPCMTWKLAFLSSFLLFSNLVLGTYLEGDERFGKNASIPVPSIIGYVLAGGLVGFGTRLGNGCTTGHGVCGMARLSIRSIAAVCTFMITGIATAVLTAPDNHVTRDFTEFLRTSDVPKQPMQWLGSIISMFIVLPTILAIFRLFAMKEESKKTAPTSQPKSINPSEDKTTQSEDDYACDPNVDLSDDRHKIIPAATGGLVFALGLAVSGMVYQGKVLGFLNLYLLSNGTYDPTLLLVMGGACIVSFVAYQFVRGWGILSHSWIRTCPLAAKKFSVPSSTMIDTQLLLGAVCFGAGWGLAGICPGPAIYLAAIGTPSVISYWWPAFLIGSFIALKVKERS
ncbi:uncharacterized protein FisN_3Hh439 [Fistulifera solaris]|uniref:Uncharacterized protein n=1 Tax=Fistulifera solaris TaxID=1519565 RepID=A0A1Z5K7Z9_FISSO|nr:uncharacterized protein FisN_3Hh439 [Fistulifera solaris]|eukprot:GAX22354.1 uncharacterized protein FisN_3Hh439 [Fistulifera solaris]